MTKHFTSLIFIFLIHIYSPIVYSQTTNAVQINSKGTIEGYIKDEKGEAIPGATIRIEEDNLTTVTNADGFYRLDKVSDGSKTMQVSSVGFQQQEQPVHIESGSIVTISLNLNQSIEQLQTVEVIGRKEKSYKNTKSFSGTKTETPLKYVPQAISYVTKEVMEDRLAFKNSDAVKNISGVNQFSYNNNDFVLRGFRASNTMVNGLRGASSGWNQSLLPYVERIEVIKGPASALFANTDPGGTINIITKKPLDEARKAISFVTGSYNTYRITTDFTGPMNKSKTLLYRLNLAYQNAESFRKLQGGQDYAIAPSISFIPDDKTQINFDIVYSYTKGRLDRGQPIFGATSGTQLNSTPISFVIGKKSDYINELNLYSTLSLKRKITDKITFNASYMKYMYDEDLMEHRTSNRYGIDADGKAIPTLMEMQTIRRMQKNYTDNLSLYFLTDFNIGASENTVLVGYDHILSKSSDGNSNYNASGFVNAEGNGVVLNANGTPASYDPKNKAKYLIKNNMPVPNVPYFDLENPDYSITDNARYFNISTPVAPNKYYVNGFYIQEQFKLGKFRALLGLRKEYYTNLLNYTKANEKDVQQEALIPRVGVVYSPLESISIYGTYAEGYQPQTASTIGAPEIYGGPFDPLISNMIEGGVKTELIKKRLAVNVAIYRIIQNNVLVNANAPDNPDLLRQIGQQRAQGVEFDVYGQILPNLSVTANMAYNKAEITESTNSEEVGKVFPNAPKVQGGFWAKYIFTNTVLNGFGVGVGSNFATERTTNDTKNNLRLPYYIVYDAALYYTVDKFRISANLNNIFNRTYWAGGFDYHRLFPGTPRNYLFGMSYTF